MRFSRRLLERLRRAFNDFLTIPIGMSIAFLVLALVIYGIDADAGSKPKWGALWRLLSLYVGDSKSATGLLTTIAGSLITVTSITFSILLLAVQQGASALTSQIIDHYLRRTSNQLYFGFFVGTSIFALVTLVLTTDGSRPVLGVTLATVFACLSLFALILLIYSTIDQIKPVTIIDTMHDVTLNARNHQIDWIARTRPADKAAEGGRPVLSECNGYLARVRLKRLEEIVRARPGLRIEVQASIGDYLPCGAVLARVVGVGAEDDAVCAAVRRALPVELQRDLGCDAGFGIDQLATIAWTSVSTAKSNPAAGAIACRALQDILFRWSGRADGAVTRTPAAVVGYDDRVIEQLMDGFESLMVVASESMQHQSLSLLMDALSDTFPHMPPSWRDRVEHMVLISLSALGDHVPTRVLGVSFGKMIAVLRQDGRIEAADKVSKAWAVLAAAAGIAHARGGRT